jgi:glucose/arabinose dehydrogenase
MRITGKIALACALAALWGCGQQGHPQPQSNVGAHPVLPAPAPQTIPTMNVNSIAPWPAGSAPQAPAGFVVTRYAENLHHPRWLYVLPNGDVLIAEAASPPVPLDSVEHVVQHWLDNKAGATPQSANDIILLRDTHGTGHPDVRTVFLSHLDQPFGMLLLNGTFYVGNTSGVVRFPYSENETQIAAAGQKILDLPTGHHWTRNLIASEDGSKILVAVGSDSNIAEKGLDAEKRRADILEINPDGTGERIYASGLRNPNGLAFEPATHALWAVVNERDQLGDDLVPDYLTSVKDGAFYGWPWAYWGQHVDSRVQPPRPDMVAKAIAPDYSLGTHVAPLGLAFYTADAFPAHYRGGAFVGEHGSWNRAALVGYKVVYVPFSDGKPSGLPEDFLTGFLPDPKTGVAYGRPVGVAVDKTGALLVADDVGNIVWRVAPAS